VTAVVLLGDIVERPTQRYLVTVVLNMWEVSMGGSHIFIDSLIYMFIYNNFFFQPFAVCSVLFMLNPELAIKFFLQFNVFVNAIAAMGTARHYQYVEATEEGRVSVYATFNVQREAYRKIIFLIVLVCCLTSMKIETSYIDW
jgi:hypothetical protein